MSDSKTETYRETRVDDVDVCNEELHCEDGYGYGQEGEDGWKEDHDFFSSSMRRLGIAIVVGGS